MRIFTKENVAVNNEHKKRFTDRLQFLGIIGPFVITLTLMTVLFRGSLKNWYLFAVTLVGLPLCWKLGLKGLLTTLGLLVLSFFCMFPLFLHTEVLWQMGASISLGLGLFISHQGFEEIKDIMADLQIESESRLDNLIELDNQFKNSQKEWSVLEEEFRARVEDKDLFIQKQSEQINNLGKGNEIIENELHRMQKVNRQNIEEIELINSQRSMLEVDLMKLKEVVANFESELGHSQTDREKKYIEDNRHLTQLNHDLKEKIYQLENILNEKANHEHSLSQEAMDYEERIRKLESAVREKMALVEELHEAIIKNETQITAQQSALANNNEQIASYEHQLLSYKKAVSDRDQKIGELNQLQRDRLQDINSLQKQILDLNQRIKELEHQNEATVASLKGEAAEHEMKIQAHHTEIETLYQELEEKGAELNKFIAQNNELEQTLRQYEEQIAEFHKVDSESAQLKKQELTALNDARFALFQANLDNERLRAQISSPEIKSVPVNAEAKNLEFRNKHWLHELESLLKQNTFRKIDLQHLPKELSQEIVTLNQTKALYNQLRTQFDDKNKALEDSREKMFKLETQLEKLKKQRDQELLENTKFEKELEQAMVLKEQEVKVAEGEVIALNAIIDQLLDELKTSKQS